MKSSSNGSINYKKKGPKSAGLKKDSPPFSGKSGCNHLDKVPGVFVRRPLNTAENRFYTWQNR